MAKDIVMQRSPDGGLVPIDSVGAEYIAKLPRSTHVGVKVTQARNYKFHKKIFALLKYLYDTLPRVEREINGVVVEQSFRTFRSEFVAISGHYKTEVTRNGTRIEAQSLSYKDCSEELAKEIFSDVIDKALLLLGNDQTREDLEKISDEILRFD